MKHDRSHKEGLFEHGAERPLAERPLAERPLAERLRPQDLSDIVGQDHLVGPDGALTRLIAAGHVPSLLLWGPPGCGKTTLAKLVAERSGLHFAVLSAVLSGVADLRRVFDAARERRAAGGGTLLFVDEIHRFNRSQQDAFLPHVEDGSIRLIGATTENPSFELNAALLSRCRVFILKRLDGAALEDLLRRAERLLGRELPVDPHARAQLIALADGDGRQLLNMVEAVLADAGATAPRSLDQPALTRLLQRNAPLGASDADALGASGASGFVPGGSGQVYALLSAFHKSLRGSDPQAALYYAARFMIMGSDAASPVWRRLACAASEDVGLADPNAIAQVMHCWQAFERVGWPEGHLFLAQAIIYVATAPKSNSAHLAWGKAMDAAERSAHVSPPLHSLNAPTRLMKQLGHGVGYKYDHDEPHAYAGQDFLPDTLVGAEFYRPVERGHEREIQKRLDFWGRLRAQRSHTEG